MVQTNEDSNNSVPPEVKAQFKALIEPFFSDHYRDPCYLGLIFQQGKRKMVQINVTARDLPTLLQAKPSTDNDPDSGKNRPVIKDHAEEIKQYVIKQAEANKAWILGTITANVDEQQITIRELGRGLCIVVIPNGVKLDITDGQHRKKAICELILSDRSHLISKDDFPITLILEGDQRQCQTDFRDMAQTKQLDKSLLLSFGEFEGCVGITKNLIERVRLFQDKTEKIKASPPTKYKRIYTTNYIARFVSSVFADKPVDELKGFDVEQSSTMLADCLDKFFSECSDTKDIAETNINNLTINNVAAFKEDSLLGVSVGLEVLGRLLFFVYKENNNFDEQKVSQLAQLDWSRNSSLWENNVVRKVTNSDQTTYKISNSPTAVKDAVEAVKSRLGWKT